MKRFFLLFIALFIYSNLAFSVNTRNYRTCEINEATASKLISDMTNDELTADKPDCSPCWDERLAAKYKVSVHFIRFLNNGIKVESVDRDHSKKEADDLNRQLDEAQAKRNEKLFNELAEKLYDLTKVRVEDWEFSVNKYSLKYDKDLAFELSCSDTKSLPECGKDYYYNYDDMELPYAVLNERCVNLVKDRYLPAFVAVAKKKLEKSKVQAEEDALAAKSAANNEISKIETILGPNNFTVSILLTNKVTSGPTPIREDVELLSSFYAFQHKKLLKQRQSYQFAPPAKGEFEKTADYQTRIAALKAEFLKEKAEKHDSPEGIKETYSKFTSGVLGYPVIASSKYNADKEAFDIVINTSHYDLKLEASVPIPLAEAKNVANIIGQSQIYLMLGITNNTLRVGGKVLLQSSYDKTISTGTIAPSSQKALSILTDAEAAKFETYLAKRNAQTEKEINYASAQSKANKASWPVWAKAKIYQGSVVCSSVQSIYKVEAIQRSNNAYVSFPDDCAETSRDGFLEQISSVNNYIVKIVIHRAKIHSYTLISNIEMK